MENTKVTSEAAQNYLKAIYQLGYLGEAVSAQQIAQQLRVSAPGVTKMLRHLAEHQLIEYTPYQPVCLTKTGIKIALEVIRHHRLLETYLTESLGYGWEQVHAEAEKLEHHISEEFEDAIERLLGFPTHDPHGDPIPSRDGILPKPVTETLQEQMAGVTVVVCRVTDEDQALLRYLGERRLRPGAVVQIVAREPFGGSLSLLVQGQDLRVSPEAARHVFVEPLEHRSSMNAHS